MRVLLKNKETNHYYAGPNEWTSDVSRAHDFEMVTQAAKMYEVEQVAFAEIVVEGTLRTSPTSQAVADAARASLEPN